VGVLFQTPVQAIVFSSTPPVHPKFGNQIGNVNLNVIFFLQNNVSSKFENKKQNKKYFFFNEQKIK